MEKLMKKSKELWFIIILSVFVFAACTNNGDQVEDEENGYDVVDEAPDNGDEEVLDDVEENGDDEVADDIEENRALFVPGWLSLTLVTEEERNMLLEDLDYLALAMLENSPLLGVIERRFGITLEDALSDMRYVIYNLEVIERNTTEEHDRAAAANNLYRLLVWFEERFERIGHFGPLLSGTYIELLEMDLAWLHQSEIVDDRIIFDGEDVGDARRLQTRIEVFGSESSLLFYDVELDELDLERDLTDFGWHIEGNVTTEIIEDDRIAYVGIGSFSSNPTFDSEVLFPFFAEVQDFEHLIIDLRGNLGGWANYFEDYIMAMLIDSPVEARFNEFLVANAVANRDYEFALASEIMPVDELLMVDDFVNEQTLPYLNESDLERLTYVIPWHFQIEPREDNIPFAGEIWLLVDHMSGSASELAAMKSMYSGFATVVGVPTRRVTPTQTTHVSLPNTGIVFRIDLGYIIDDLGRSLEEYGVTPDILSESGGVALDVVLDLIEEQ